jgi:hypothetical protein
MSKKMNWSRASKTYGRKTLDHRFERDIPDRADRWLAKAEQRERRTRPQMTAPSTIAASSDWLLPLAPGQLPW